MCFLSIQKFVENTAAIVDHSSSSFLFYSIWNTCVSLSVVISIKDQPPRRPLGKENKKSSVRSPSLWLGCYIIHICVAYGNRVVDSLVFFLVSLFWRNACSTTSERRDSPKETKGVAMVKDWHVTGIHSFGHIIQLLLLLAVIFIGECDRFIANERHPTP